MPVQCFSHFGICVADPERSLRFYRDLLGFRPLSNLEVADALGCSERTVRRLLHRLREHLERAFLAA